MADARSSTIPSPCSPPPGSPTDSTRPPSCWSAPVAIVGSWRRLGWTTYFHELLEQPLLMRDLLGPYDERMRALVGLQDHVAKIALLWCAVYDAVAQLCADNPALHLVHYESLASDPVAEFHDL